MIKILVLTDFSSGYSRRLLEGMIRYSKEVGPWSFLRIPSHYQATEGDRSITEYAKKWKADAIVAQLRDLDLDALRKLNIPIIVQNYKDRRKNISNLTGDYYNTGKMAADFFLARGYKYFAYYGFKDTVWSRERHMGYQDQLEKSDLQCDVLMIDSSDDKELVYNVEQVESWLLALPKPVAVFACDDYFALQVSETCNSLNISIPNDVAILGVDNDELLCNLSTPTLSSIVLDVENGGYQAAKLLHKLIEKEIDEDFNIIIEPLYIEDRGSTEKYAVGDEHVQIILDYIHGNFNKKIAVQDLVELVPLSRRVLEKKFKEATGSSIYQCVLDHRIEYFVKLLLNTDCHLPDAAVEAGFDDYKNVSRIFKKYKSISPVEYRKLYKDR